MDRRHEIEIARRSIAMLWDGRSLDRDEALALIQEVDGLAAHLARVRSGLVAFVDGARTWPPLR